MQINLTGGSLTDFDEDLLVVPVFENDGPWAGMLADVERITSGGLSRAVEAGEVGEKPHSWTLLGRGDKPGARVLLYAAGKARAAGGAPIQQVAGGVVRVLAERGIGRAAILLRDNWCTEPATQSVVEGAMLANETGELYKSGVRRRVESLTLIPERDGFSPAAAIETARIMGDATNFARVLGDEPPNVLTPSELASRAEEMSARVGLRAEILGEEEMKHQGMGALLAVARGSVEPARLITLAYDPEDGAGSDGAEVIVLVGKGITFDSGGISIKPAEKMDEMKYDMGGAAAVLGAMQAIAHLKPPVKVRGVVPAAENLPSGKAVKPGDVVRSLSGRTIEVINTDAEGRLILADALTYGLSLGATTLVDAATLTGACVIALGEVRAGVMGSDQNLVDELMRTGEACGERLWQLPLDREYGELVKSEIADIKNVGNRTAGAITAAAFLKTFTQSVPWAHVDIAGTAWLGETKPYMLKGATGFGVRLFANFVLGRSAVAERIDS